MLLRRRRREAHLERDVHAEADEEVEDGRDVAAVGGQRAPQPLDLERQLAAVPAGVRGGRGERARDKDDHSNTSDRGAQPRHWVGAAGSHRQAEAFRMANEETLEEKTRRRRSAILSHLRVT